ncbi:MAG: M13 family metallopeptidase [Parvularculaceae bacterium]
MIRFHFFCAALAMLAATPAAANEASGAAPVIEPWGYPLTALDPKTRPGDDFYRFANGGWLDATAIPADRSGAGFSTDMRERNEERIATIIISLAKSNVRANSDEQRIRDLGRSFMDVERIEAMGLAPIAGDLQRIRKLKSLNDVAAMMGDPSLDLEGPFAANIAIDSKNPGAYAVWLYHAGLGLPDKSYYERESERLAAIRDAYRKHVGVMLAHAGFDPAHADAVVELEKKIAALHWNIEDRREATRTYNPVTRDELETLAPGFPWRAYFKAAGLGRADSFIVQEKDAFPGLAALFAETPVDVWRDYLAFHLMTSFAGYLSAEIDDANFAFFGAALTGQAEQRAREKRCIDLVNDELDQAVGKIYIDRYFPPESKALMASMFDDIRAALRERIEHLSWMTAPTRAAALVKLEKMNARIAYPDKWRAYSGLYIRGDDIVGNIKRIRKFDAAYYASLLGKPVDKRTWFTGPQTVNAFYSPERNEVFIPAGYIQSPLFDPHADAAINYGAIGSIIGHEIGHGFDDQGSKFNGDGALVDWWTPEDRAAFDALGDRFAAQFDAYEPLPGLHVNGRLTLGENIGDLAGVVVAYHAYMLSLDGQPAPVLDGFTGAQRVFLGRAQARRFKQTEESLRRRLLSDPHSPMDLRVNGMVRNIDEWYEAFGVKPGDSMYLAPEDRVYIW